MAKDHKDREATAKDHKVKVAMVKDHKDREVMAKDHKVKVAMVKDHRVKVVMEQETITSVVEDLIKTKMLDIIIVASVIRKKPMFVVRNPQSNLI